MSGDAAVCEGLDETGTARAGQAPPTVPVAIEVSYLTKVFGGRTAVSDVSFSVKAGEVFGFLGPTGAGRTTTARSLGTLIAPTSGSAIVAGIPLSPKNSPAIRSRISITPESLGLHLRLTVMENLRSFAGLYELDDVRGRIGRALRAVNLEAHARDLCGSLSKGLRQRVALARPRLNDPAVLFLDEPTSGLEPVLIPPIRREDFLIAKAPAAFVPALVISYAIFGIFLAVTALPAHPVIASAICAGTHALVQLLFTPLIAGWAIWVGIAVSAGSMTWMTVADTWRRSEHPEKRLSRTEGDQQCPQR